MSWRFALFALALVVLAPPGMALAQQATLTDDVQTSAADPNTNLGGRRSLHVFGGSDRVFLKFALASKLPPGTVGAHVGKATLQLFVSAVGVPGPVDLFDVDGAWSEPTITHATAPVVGPQLGRVFVDPDQAGSWVTLDVTAWVQARIDDVAPNDGLVVFAPAGADVTFDSKENRTTSHEPRLEIVLTHAATADNASQLGGVPAASFVQAGDPALTAPRPPAAGSPHYIQNQVAAAQAAGFSITGDGTAGGTLSGRVVNATGQFELAGQRILAIAGSSNLFAGLGAGVANVPGVTSGIRNSFFGSNAGRANTTGATNSFFGSDAGGANNTGVANAFFGAQTGTQSNGSANSFFGALAGAGNTTGTANTFIGHRAGGNAAIANTGTRNTLLGAEAQLGAGNLSFATAIGAGAVVSASNRIVLGRPGGPDVVEVPGTLRVTNGYDLGGQPLLRVKGTNEPLGASLYFGPAAGASASPTVGLNTYVGSNAGQATTTGSRNAFFGSNAGRANTASDNSFFGSSAGFSNTSGDRNAFFGITAGASNTIGCCNSFFGNKVGLNNTEGRGNAFFGGSAGRSNTLGSFNSYFGDLSGFGLSAGTDNSFFGFSSGRVVATGTRITLLGSSTSAANNLTNATAVGANALVSSSNSLVLGSIRGVNAAGADTFVGIGTTSPVFPLDIKGANADGNAAARIESPVGTAILSLESTIGGRNQVWNLENGVFQVPGLFAIFDRSAFQARLAIDTEGRVGIGTTEPTSRLTVTGLIETSSAAGGVKFPDGTIQTTAATDAPDLGDAYIKNGAAPQAAGFNITGNGTLGGALTAGSLSGHGGGLTGLHAGNIASGTLDNARLGLIPTANIADSAVTAGKVAPGQVVKTLNGLTDGVSLAAGPNVTITPSGNTLTISAAGAGGAGILNQTALQAGASFNIDGAGKANSFDAATQYHIAGSRFASAPATTGSTIVGFLAGDVTTGGANSFYGFQAGERTTNGTSNSFFGFQAGQFHVSGGSNSFFGMRAGFRNTAAANSFFGASAGQENTSGMSNSHFGVAAGRDNVTGNSNSIFGFDAGVFSKGSGNTFVGAHAGLADSTGGNNTLVGVHANVGANNLTNATAIGANAVVSRADSLVLGHDADVGIGTSAPRARLDVQGGSVYVGSPGQGIVLKSPDGATCALLAIDNAGALVTMLMPACP